MVNVTISYFTNQQSKNLKAFTVTTFTIVNKKGQMVNFIAHQTKQTGYFSSIREIHAKLYLQVSVVLPGIKFYS